MGLYFLQKMQDGHSLPTTDATFFPIKFYHTSLLDTDPCQHSLVKNMFEAAKRLSNHKTKKKQALRPNELKQIYGHLSANQSSLENLRLLNICVIAFTGFMRFSEVTSIKDYDIIFTETYMKIFIEKSKTDICRERAWVYISRSHKMCRMKHLEDYLRLVNINISSSQYTFRAISKCKKSTQEKETYLIHYDSPKFIKVYKSLWVKWKDNGLHSLRAGGTSLTANKEIPDRLFNATNVLSVSKNLQN